MLNFMKRDPTFEPFYISTLSGNNSSDITPDFIERDLIIYRDDPQCGNSVKGRSNPLKHVLAYILNADVL